MSKRKLLLADDSITIQKVVNLTFADEGIEVFTVGDGDSAMEKLNEVSPDLVMADVNMPGLNGYQICEKIRQSDSMRQTPVILLVGSFEPFDEAEAKRVGADDFLTKPFQSIRQLVNKVTVLLNSGGREPVAEELTQSVAANSFAETLEMPKPTEFITEEFSHSDFDDEMIQTDQLSGFALDESHKFESKADSNAGLNEIDYGKTQPLSSEDIKDFAFSEIYQESPAGEELTAAAEEVPVSDVYPVAEEVPVPTESYDAYATRKYDADEIAGEYSINRFSEEAHEENIPEEPATYEVASEEDKSYDTASQPAVENESDGEESTASLMESPEEIVSEYPVETTSDYMEAKTEDPLLPSSESVLDIDEDILELPPMEEELEEEGEEMSAQPIEQAEESSISPEVGGPTGEDTSFVSEPAEDTPVIPEPAEEETAIIPEAAEEETPSIISESSLEEPVAAIEEPAAAVEEPPVYVSVDGSNAFRLSPELIEAIAQKVIEKLSDKAIKDVAWEVVPQMAELIVKQIAEEKLKE